jgi:hypothetical protein
MDGVALDGRVGDSGDGDEGEDGERDHVLGIRRDAGFLELTADVATRVDAVAEGQDVDHDERGHEGDERDHVYMIGRNCPRA